MDVTSDSIAAWIAHARHGRRLAPVTAVRGQLRRVARAAAARLRRLGAVARGVTVGRLHADARVRVRVEDRGRLVLLRLPLEEYVAGTVAAESPASWPAETLKAQAVVSRTYALHRLVQPRGLRHDLSGSVLDQVFQPGLAVGAAVSLAVDATRAEYLADAGPGDRGGAPINALFHRSCGGATDTASGVWGDGTVGRGVPCATCARTPFTWTATVEVAAILAALGLPAAAPDSVRLLAMARTPSARLRALRIETGHRGRTVSAEAFRGLLGYHRVRSACFEWSSAADGRIRLAGVGAGHGVGLCQAGAGGLGAQGRSYIEILTHYYPGSHLARLPARQG